MFFLFLYPWILIKHLHQHDEWPQCERRLVVNIKLHIKCSIQAIRKLNPDRVHWRRKKRRFVGFFATTMYRKVFKWHRHFQSTNTSACASTPRSFPWKEHLTLLLAAYSITLSSWQNEIRLSHRSRFHEKKSSRRIKLSIKHFASRFPFLTDSIFLFSSNVKSLLKLFPSLYVELIEQVNHPPHDDRKTLATSDFCWIIQHSFWWILFTISYYAKHWKAILCIRRK